MKRKMQLDQKGIQITEDQAQRAVFRWAKDAAILWPELRYMYHTPNEGKRNPYTGQRLKAEGMRSGVPDICLPAPRGKYHGLYIEMKVGRNKPTPEQEDFLTYLAGAGYKSLACWGEKSTIRAIESYLKLPKEEEPCIDVPMKSEPKGE